MARLSIIGNVGRDAELRMTPNGKAVAEFSVAVNRKQGSEESTDWYRVSCWGRLSEIAQQYVKKGGTVYAEGRFQPRTYTDKSGAPRVSYDLSADNIVLLGGGTRESDAGAPADDAEIPF